MRVLMTGSTGFVGLAMIGNSPNTAHIDGLNHEDYDLKFYNVIPFCEYVIHLAPILPTVVIDYARRWQSRILFASSGAAYSSHPTEYGKMKLEGERMLKDSGVDYVTARMFTFMGPHMKWDNFAVGNFIRDAVAGGPINIMGNGYTLRSYMYAKDMAEWLWAILLKGKRGETYDVGAERSITMIELAERIAHEFTPMPEIRILNKIEHEQAPIYLPRTAARTREELGLHETFTVDEMIKLTIEAYKNEKV